jgi:pimeloyl-ACP methyl ester carboxylesterase
MPSPRPRRITQQLRHRLKVLRRDYLADAGVALKEDFAAESHTLLITFGGLGAGRGPGFEFESSARELPVKRLFVTDPRQCWYNRGSSRGGTTLASVADSLAELLSKQRIDRLVTVGNSAGAYAALIFGTLLGADHAVCFAPQTVLDIDVLHAMDDHRWDALLLPLSQRGVLEPRWSDLRLALPPVRRADTRYDVYFDETIRCDRLHAERLRDLEGVRLYRFGRGGHRLVRDLRDIGALERLLRRALHLPPAPGDFAGTPEPQH